MWMVTVKIECEREERLFSRVAAVLRLAVPLSRTCNNKGTILWSAPAAPCQLLVLLLVVCWMVTNAAE
jgi:hypothetical protein